MRVLGIAAELSASPSSPSVFRDVSLQSSIRGYDVVAIAPRETHDSYNRWFKKYGIWDFISDLVPHEQVGYLNVEIEGGRNARLTAHNLHAVIAML